MAHGETHWSLVENTIQHQGILDLVAGAVTAWDFGLTSSWKQWVWFMCGDKGDPEGKAVQRLFMVHKCLCFTFPVVAGKECLAKDHCYQLHLLRDEVMWSVLTKKMWKEVTCIFSSLISAHVFSTLFFPLCLGSVNSETLETGRAQRWQE